MTELIVRDDISFRLGHGWTALSAPSTHGEAWQHWAEGLAPAEGEGVVPEVVRTMVRTAQRPLNGSWHVSVAGGPAGSLAFVFALDPRGTDTILRRQYEQIARWTGVRIDASTEQPRYEEHLGDAYDTADLGLHGAAIRHYAGDRVVAFALAPSREDAATLLSRLSLPDTPRTFESPPEVTVPEGMLPYDPEWASYVDPKTLRFERASGVVPVGAIVLEKRRGEERVETHYLLAEPAGLRALGDKSEAQATLLAAMLAQIEGTGRLPLHTTLGRRFKNGTLELVYEPNRYDRFVVKVGPEDLGGRDPIATFEALGEAPKATFRQKPVDEDATPWKVEAAKSSRAACRACKEAIQKGSTRLGEPYDYQGSITFRWYHLACASERLRTPEKLHGFAELAPAQQAEVRTALSGQPAA